MSKKIKSLNEGYQPKLKSGKSKPIAGYQPPKQPLEIDSKLDLPKGDFGKPIKK